MNLVSFYRGRLKRYIDIELGDRVTVLKLFDPDSPFIIGRTYEVVEIRRCTPGNVCYSCASHGIDIYLKLPYGKREMTCACVLGDENGVRLI